MQWQKYRKTKIINAIDTQHHGECNSTMDDLLALMEETPPTEEAETTVKSPDTDRNRGSQSRSTSRRSQTQNSSRDQTNGFAASFSAPSPEPQQQQLAMNVDDRVGIRMIRRKVSSIDLIDIVSENPYHSTASLSAMSLAALNRLLVDPAAVLDPANVCGKTGMVTVGVVFSNSGTRMAASGNAFCVLTIGNLRTGPAVSVMLFGSAYSAFCRNCVPGKVIALLSPRLIPSKSGSGPKDTSVTFSLSDERQLKLLADARDYGVCKAAIRGKRVDGQWVADAKKCKHFVDIRSGEYCQMHRKQANFIKGSCAKGTTVMQQLRVEASAFPTNNTQGRSMTAPSQGAIMAATPVQEAAHSAQMMAQFQARTMTGSNLRGVPMQMSKQPTNTNNSILAPRSQVSQPSSKNSLLAPRNNQAPRNGLTQNPYATQGRSATPRVSQPAKKPAVTQGRTSAAPRAAQPTKNPIVKQDWLQGGSKRRGTPLNNLSATTGTKRRAVNTEMGGFNGTVPVPKASGLFAGGPAVHSSAHARADARFQPKQRDEAKKQMIAQQQKEVAARLREQTQKSDGKSSAKGITKSGGGRAQPKAAADSRQAQRDSLFGSGPMNDADKERITNKKSRFSNEADAEEYAKSRRIVSELENEESKKEFKASKTNKSQGNNGKGTAGSIKTEYFCQTCKQTFSKKPLGCYNAKHPVKVDRTINAAKSIDEKRLTLSGKHADDGGLKLGSGLEWSRNRFS
jgi:minichromosome maintenance protein 10